MDFLSELFASDDLALVFIFLFSMVAVIVIFVIWCIIRGKKDRERKRDTELPTSFESGDTVTITKQDSHTYHTTLEKFRESNPEFAKEIEKMMEKSNGKAVIRRKVRTTKFGFSTKRSDVIKDSGDDWLSKQRELEDK